jgi:hypothetical protein
VVRRFVEAGIEHRTLDWPDGSLVVVAAYGARTYGPFANEGSASANWVPEVFSDPAAFADVVGRRWWNLGGERLWVGPEIQYMIPDRADYWGTYALPGAMDPGSYSIVEGPGRLRLTQRLRLEAHNLGHGAVELESSVEVRPGAHPLRDLEEAAHLVATVGYVGYTQEVTLSCTTDEDPVSESWNLQQVRPGGVVLIPAVPHARVTDYYEPAGMLVSAGQSGIVARITGDQRYKVGFKAPQVFGRVGYLRAAGVRDRAQLLVRTFTNAPGTPYAEEPDFAPGLRGDSLHLYNDDGGLGGFGELEARGRTIGRGTGRRRATDTFTSWWFTGTSGEVSAIAALLLGAVVAETAGE